MFNFKENDTNSYSIQGAQLGAAVGGYASLALGKYMVLNFLVCLTLGYLFGLWMERKKY